MLHVAEGLVDLVGDGGREGLFRGEGFAGVGVAGFPATCCGKERLVFGQGEAQLKCSWLGGRRGEFAEGHATRSGGRMKPTLSRADDAVLDPNGLRVVHVFGSPGAEAGIGVLLEI